MPSPRADEASPKGSLFSSLFSSRSKKTLPTDSSTAQASKQPGSAAAPGQLQTPALPTHASSQRAGKAALLSPSAASATSSSAAATTERLRAPPATASPAPAAQMEAAPVPTRRISRGTHARTPSLACEFQQPRHQHKPSLASAAAADAHRNAAARISLGSMLASLTPEELLMTDGLDTKAAQPPAAAGAKAPASAALATASQNSAVGGAVRNNAASSSASPRSAQSDEAAAATAKAAALAAATKTAFQMSASIVASAVAGKMARAAAVTTASTDAAKHAAAQHVMKQAVRLEQGSSSTSKKAGSTLLAVFSLLPHKLRRETWRLDDFEVEKRLHQGYASQVFKARCLLSGVEVALKVYDLRGLHEINQVQLLREIELHSSIVHNNVVALYAAFQEGYHVILVQEWCGGGDLHSLLRKQCSRMTELVAIQTVLQPLLSSLVYLHARGITHRDIKPENLLLSDTGVLKLADFGLAIDLTKEAAVTRAGTLDYMAPEVLVCPLKAKPDDNKDNRRLHYGSSVDAWSVGVLGYELVAGFPPFSGADQKQTTKNIMAGQIMYPKRLSDCACDFLADAMSQHPADRPNAMEMMNHPWMRIRQRRTSADGGAGNGASSLTLNVPSSAEPSSKALISASSKGPLTPTSPRSSKLPALTRANTARQPFDTSAMAPLAAAAVFSPHGSHAAPKRAATGLPLLSAR